MDGILGTGVGRGASRGIADMGGRVSPILDPSERRAMIPAASELQFLFTISLGPWGKWE